MLAENDNNYERADLDLTPNHGKLRRLGSRAPASFRDRFDRRARWEHVEARNRARFEGTATLPARTKGQLARWSSGRRRTGLRRGDRFPRCFWLLRWSWPTSAAVIWLGGSSPGKLRTGATPGCATALAVAGLDDRWLLPLLARRDPAGMAGRELPRLAVLAGNPGGDGRREPGLGGHARRHQPADRRGFSYLEQRGTAVLAIEPAKATPVRRLLDRIPGRGRL